MNDFQWVNLENSNIQEISRPDPVGLAKCDSSTQAISSHSISSFSALGRIPDSGISATNNFVLNAYQELSDGQSRDMLSKRVGPAQDGCLIESVSASLTSSLQSSSTVYKDITPNKSQLETPSLTENKAFLQKSKGGTKSDVTLNESGCTDQGTQVGESKLLFSICERSFASTYDATGHDVSGVKTADSCEHDNVLEEQDISSASNYERGNVNQNNNVKEHFTMTDDSMKTDYSKAESTIFHTRSLKTSLTSNITSDVNKDSEGELLITDLTGSMTTTSKSSINTSLLYSSGQTTTSKGHLSSITKVLDPINEIPSPHSRDVISNSYKASSSSTYPSFKSTSVKSASSPYFPVDTPHKYNSFKLSIPKENKSEISNVPSNEKFAKISNVLSPRRSTKRQGLSSKNLSKYRSRSPILEKSDHASSEQTSSAASSLRYTQDERISDISKRFDKIQLKNYENVLTMRPSEVKPIEKKLDIKVTSNSLSDDTDQLLSHKTYPVIESDSTESSPTGIVKNALPVTLPTKYQAHERCRRGLDSLANLWTDFDKSFQKKKTSPVLQKLNLLTEILKTEKAHRKYLVVSSASPDSTITSSVDSSVKSSTKKNPVKDKLVHKPKPFSLNTPKFRELSCPYCLKKEASTNAPTPSFNHIESDTPLMLQTWTQTVSIAMPKFQNNVTRKNEKSNKGSPRKFQTEKENDKNFINIEDKTSSTYDIIEPNIRLKNNSKDFAYTAWFQTVRSDASNGIEPLNKFRPVPKTFKQRERNVGPLTLQEAFVRSKQNFIQRSKLRQQHTRDHRLDENHANYMYYHQTAIARKTRKQQTQQKNIKQSIVKTTKKRSSPEYLRRVADSIPMVNYRKAEEEKGRIIRMNRLKMKRYDVKIRSRFLRKPPSPRHPTYTVERH